MTKIAIVALAGALVLADAKGLLVNTEAGTFRCPGKVVRVAPGGIPVSGEPGGELKPCDMVVEAKDAI